MAVEDLELPLAFRIAHRQAHHEPVELGLGQRVGAFVLDRVLGRDHHERPFKCVSGAVDRDLPLLHALEQRGLRFRRRPVDLVAQDDVRKHRPLPEPEALAMVVPHVHAGHVRGEQVGRELDPAPRAAERAGQRLREHGLADAGHILEKDVSLGHEADHRQADDIVLSLDGLLDVGNDALERGLKERKVGVRSSRAPPNGRGIGHAGFSLVRVAIRLDDAHI
jgi:hypothetical protein